MKNLKNRLGVRLAMLLTLALLPLGTIAIYSEFTNWASQRNSAVQQILTRSAEAVTGKRALLESAMLSARALGSEVLSLQDDVAACSAYLRDFVAQSGFYSFAGFIDISGQMQCASSGDPVNFKGEGTFEQAISQPRASFSFQGNGVVSQRAVVVAHHPVFEDDALRGYVSVSIGQDQLALISPSRRGQDTEKVVFLANHIGDALTETASAVSLSRLPENNVLEHLFARPDSIRQGQSVAGETRLFALTTLIPEQLYALGSWDSSVQDTIDRISLWRLAFPVLMWAASVAVVLFSVHYLVVRHLKQINRQLRGFALGNRETTQRLPADAARELQDIDSTFNKMALLIQRDEIAQEQSLREQTTLLMEVHHRVKNNFQLIASILNLQMRRVTDPSARAILKGVQARVRSLATIHRVLYEQKQVSLNDATAFFETILQESLTIAHRESAPIDVRSSFEPVAIPPEKTIPVSMVFAEALGNALTHLTDHPAETQKQLHIACLNHGDHAELTVRNTCHDKIDEAPQFGLGHDLMTAFAMQINAELEIGPHEEDGTLYWRVQLRIALPTEDRLASQSSQARKLP